MLPTITCDLRASEGSLDVDNCLSAGKRKDQGSEAWTAKE